jgi:hypothetical protein
MDLSDRDRELAQLIAEHQYRPDVLAMILWEWGKGDLHGIDAPDEWQMRFLRQLGGFMQARNFNGVDAAKLIRMARGSGRGIGKSALVAMLVVILMASWRNAKITVTANTEGQLDSKTWPEIRAWLKRSLVAHWFDANSAAIRCIGHAETWFCAKATWSEENPQAFAGQHNRTSANVVIFDEASTIPHVIWDVTLGGMTTGLPLFFAFGNVTSATGDFTDAICGVDNGLYDSAESIDARTCRFPNKEKIAEDVARYGEDSDYVRVWVRGLPPKAGDLQFISLALVERAQKQSVHAAADEPITCGVDLAWGGTDKTCIRFAQGADWGGIPPIYIPGDLSGDETQMVMRLASVLDTRYFGKRIAVMAIDSAGTCGNIVRRLKKLGHENIVEVNFGGHAPAESQYELMRSHMLGLVKEGMQAGASIDSSSDLRQDMITPSWAMTRDVKILVEPKQKIRERLGRSTDDLDALALAVFAQTLVPPPVRPDPQVFANGEYRSDYLPRDVRSVWA